MKKKYSNNWNSSTQVRKQRKYRHNAPLHVRQKFASSNLSKELRAKMKTRSMQIRKEDKVKVMRGEFAGKSGKVTLVELKRCRIAVEGLQRQKKDGTKINVFFHPSNVQIQELVERKMKQKKENKTETKQEGKEKK